MRCSPTVNVYRLKPVFERAGAPAPEPVADLRQECEHEVERVRGVTRYLVRWRGYSARHCARRGWVTAATRWRSTMSPPRRRSARRRRPPPPPSAAASPPLRRLFPPPCHLLPGWSLRPASGCRLRLMGGISRTWSGMVLGRRWAPWWSMPRRTGRLGPAMPELRPSGRHDRSEETISIITMPESGMSGPNIFIMER